MNEDPPSLAAVPRAAAVAGVVFALLFGAALLTVRMSIPGSIAERGGWLADPAGTLRLATHLLAWGGIAFLWFIGVVRTHIGAREDRFLASVYFGSGVLFLGMCFVAAAGTQALLAAHAQYGERFFDSGTFSFGSRLTYELSNTYALRMAGVFMFSLATLCHRTGAMPRLFVWVTWGLAALLVLGLTQTLWAALLFGIAPGTANASGSTTSELRVLALKATARPASGASLKARATNQPISGARIANAT
ncbi:MAG: hypothetical protein KA148_13315 [Ottowia sp.]|nr:hypothetical protein [Ottowia sp.]